ncbi:restriction endonuclease [Nocardia sp. ET3-3]|uniref:Restriction endonuclease n=1 Tax=Nocardia terrae TaxID=2675851 RepID=A0A7K1V6T9_9NOCA|nr:restriction endonuclease [Nocardia terrae]MVU82316.1 restriction endonuclease [Nocardia terrae]
MKLKAEWQCGADDPGALRVLVGRDVDREGAIASPDDDTVWARPPEQFQLRLGDVLVRRIYRPSASGGMILAAVRQCDLPAVAADSLLVLRPRDNRSARELGFALRFLRTPVAQILLDGTVSRMRDSVLVDRKALDQLVVPQPDQALADALEELEAAKIRLRQWQTQADEILDSVFLDQTPAVARARVIDSGRTLRLRVEAAALLDDLGHTVRTRFPYPIAARWRTAHALQSAGPSREAYGAILDVTEILLCYAALVTLALAREAGIHLGAAKELQTKLQRGRSGPGLGEWIAILTETATSKQFRSLPTTHPLSDLRGLLANSVVEKARQRLTARRNDQAHMRHVDLIALPDAIRDATRDLNVVIEAARFLTDWPLVQVTTVRRDTLTKISRVEYRELMGDHPAVPITTAEHNEGDLEIDSLYLRGPDQRLHLLRPYLIGRDCPICRTWSSFHVDRVPTSTVVIKSLEHGHTVEDPALLNTLKIVGLT